jgi:hypothetical protein
MQRRAELLGGLPNQLLDFANSIVALDGAKRVLINFRKMNQ